MTAQEVVKNSIAFLKERKSNEEFSLCENLTAMCEWAI